MGLLNFIFENNETKKMVFIKPFEEGTCKQKEQLENLLLKVGDDQKEIVLKELNLVNIGLQGESKVAYELKNIYDISGYVFHDICLKYNDVTAQMDFVIVTPKFICVIEAKKLNGNITIDSEGNFIRSFIDAKGNVYKKEGMDSPVMQNKKHCDLLRNLLVSNKLIRELPVLSLICCSNSKAMIKKAYAPKEIQDIVIKTDQVANKLSTYYKMYADFDMKKKQLEKVVEFISEHIVEREVDYVSKLHLKLMETKIEEKTIFKSDEVQETVKEEVLVEVPQNDDLYESLKEYRINKSKELNYKPYYIFNNDQLEQLILKRPLDIKTLSNYKILNEKQFELYGQDIVNIIVSHSKKEVEEKEALEENKVYQKLKAYRYAIAVKNNIKPYMIFNNEQLNELVQKLPSNKEKLLAINGFAEKKFELYGEDILRIISLNK